MRISWMVGAAIALAGCGGSQNPKPTPEKAGMTLGLAELSFYEGDDLGLKLHADGSIEMKGKRNGVESWEVLGKITADGKLLDKAGEMKGELLADGSVRTKTGELPPSFRLGEDSVTIEGKTVTLDDKGVFLQDGKPGEPPFRVEGANDAATRRTALLMIAFVTTGGPPHEEVTPASTPPATP